MEISNERWLEIHKLWKDWLKIQEADGHIIPPLHFIISLTDNGQHVLQEIANQLGVTPEEFEEYYFSLRRFELPIG